jgi:ABC-type branched-subunit amino acid transport system ATPase component
LHGIEQPLGVEIRGIRVAGDLSVRGLTVHYGGIVALDSVALHVSPGELVGLIGPNGAGKTTMVDAVSGFTAYAGEVELDGRSLDNEPPHHRVRVGLARTWQSVELFEDLTVARNCEVAAHHLGIGDLLADTFRPGRRRRDEAVDRALEAMGLTDVADELPTDLPHGTQKLVGVARALAASPSVLLLDEPAAGLDSHESVQFGVRLRKLVDVGTSVLLIDHDTELVMDVCDRVYVLDFGSVISNGTPEEVRADPVVVEAYLGVGAQRLAGGAHRFPDPGGAGS